MINIVNIGNKKGMTLIELLVVISIIGLLAAIGIPEYARFAAKDSVRRATNDLLQNMRLARTLAIKENREYLITFNEAGANTYSIGFDGNGDGDLNDAGVDGYEGGAVRTIDLRATYGTSIIFGTTATSGPDQPDLCPACIAIGGSTVAFGTTANPVREVFNPDGSVDFTGSVFITHSQRGFTYMLRISFQSGKIDLWAWDGDINNPNPTVVNNCTGSPVRYCGWTEVR